MTGGPNSHQAPIDADHMTQARKYRSVRLRAAVATGSAAKGLSFCVQLIAVGVAVRALGSEAFGSYLVMASLVSWLGLAAVGVGPGLTQRIAVATANDDAAGQATAFSSSVALSGLIIIVASACVLTMAGVAISGEQGTTAINADVRTAALVLFLVTAIQVWLSVVEAAQLGHQEQYFANAFQSAGNATVLALLLLGGHSLGTVTAFVVVTACPPLLAKIGNATLYVARRPYLLARHLSIREAAGILSTSIAFAALSLAATASQQLGFLWLAFVAGPAAAVPLGLMFRLNSAASGMVGLLTQPLWPAVADAVARRDLAWARRAYRGASQLTVSYAIAYAVGLGTVGGVFVRAWTGVDLDVPQLLLVLFGLYFVVGVWAHVNAITLVGLGNVWLAARIICLEAIISCAGALLLVAQFGATGVILSLLIATASVSATLLPLAVRWSWPSAARGAVAPLASAGTDFSL